MTITKIDTTNNIIIKQITINEWNHYKSLLTIDIVRTCFPRIYEVEETMHNDIKYMKIFMQKIGIPVSRCSSCIQSQAKIFVMDYIDELHKHNLYHGDILTQFGIGIHLDNILYDDDTDDFYIIDFNYKSSVEIEQNLKKLALSLCSHIPSKSKKYKIAHNNNDYSSRILFN